MTVDDVADCVLVGVWLIDLAFSAFIAHLKFDVFFIDVGRVATV